MNQQQFRAVIALLLAIVIAFGLYLGWHFTHNDAPCPRPVGMIGVIFDYSCQHSG
jgi:hypothetical protein